MTEYVRVKQKATGHELSVPRSHYEAVRDGYVLLDRPATYAAGDPLPVKHRRSIEDAGEHRRAQRKSAAKKSAAKKSAVKKAASKPE